MFSGLQKMGNTWGFSWVDALKDSIYQLRKTSAVSCHMKAATIIFSVLLCFLRNPPNLCLNTFQTWSTLCLVFKIVPNYEYMASLSYIAVHWLRGVMQWGIGKVWHPGNLGQWRPRSQGNKRMFSSKATLSGFSPNSDPSLFFPHRTPTAGGRIMGWATWENPPTEASSRSGGPFFRSRCEARHGLICLSQTFSQGKATSLWAGVSRCAESCHA